MVNGVVRLTNWPGVEVILDDREERPGVKFEASEMVGFPIRVGIGEKSLAKGEVEIKRRAGPLTPVKADEAVPKVLIQRRFLGFPVEIGPGYDIF